MVGRKKRRHKILSYLKPLLRTQTFDQLGEAVMNDLTHNSLFSMHGLFSIIIVVEYNLY